MSGDIEKISDVLVIDEQKIFDHWPAHRITFDEKYFNTQFDGFVYWYNDGLMKSGKKFVTAILIEGPTYAAPFNDLCFYSTSEISPFLFLYSSTPLDESDDDSDF